MRDKTLILNEEDITLRIRRMAWELFEKHQNQKELIIAGVYFRGFELAKRLAKRLQEICDLKISLAELHIDKEKPFGQTTEVKGLKEDFEGKCIVVVDDVLNSGKTMINALQPFLIKRVYSITTAVLVDRNHNRFPIKADIIGLSLATTLQEHVDVQLENESVYLT